MESSYDNHNTMKSDAKGMFLVKHSETCFNSCIDKIKEGGLSDVESGCIKKCYENLYRKYNEKK